MNQPTHHSILLTIDVEDWFQVENFKPCIPPATWSARRLRVEKSTHQLLDLFDAIKLNRQTPTADDSHSKFENRNSKIVSTFFILGWIAERLPGLVRDIHARGHEVASHGCNHALCRDVSVNDLREDLIRSKELLEDMIGDSIYGYRAPSFSIDRDVLEVIRETGYIYDSSYNSFAMHGRYGRLDLVQCEKEGIAIKISKFEIRNSKILFELPISNLVWKDHVIPWGGGGYFRLIPSPIFRLGVRSILKRDAAYLFYCHPWEFDPEQPKVRDASRFYRFRHYVNIDKTCSKLQKLIESFKHCRFVSCKQYLETITRQD